MKIPYAAQGTQAMAVRENMTNLCQNDAKCQIALALRQAAEHYMQKVLEGLGGLTDEEIEEKIAEFKELFKPCPETATPEELAAFWEKLTEFKNSLLDIQAKSGREMLITSAAEGAAKEEMDCFASLIRARITRYNP